MQPAPYRVTPPKKDQVAPQRGEEQVDGGVRVVDHRDDYLGCKLKVTVKAAQGLSSATGEVGPPTAHCVWHFVLFFPWPFPRLLVAGCEFSPP